MLNRNNLLRISFVVALTGLISACGFHLRGTAGSGIALPDDWRSMHLRTGNPNSELSREVENRFAAQGIEWDERVSANYTLILGPERFNQRNLSLTAEARAAEFELTMSTDFSVLDTEGIELIPNTRASVIKQMENDPRNVVGKSEEVRLLRSEMRGELAQQIMRRIGFYSNSAAATGARPAASSEPAAP